MSNSIKVSQKHGVNPTIPVCFWCGEDKNELYLLGKLKDDAEAPMRAVYDYEPCDKCKGFIEKGVQLIGATTDPIQKGMPPIAGNEESGFLYPTHTFTVVKEEFVREFLENEPQEFLNNVLEKKVLVIPVEILNQMLSEARAAEEVQDIEE